MLNVISFLFFLAVTSISAYAYEPVRSQDGVVSRISKGDAIEVTDSNGAKVKVRLYGIDCPETEKRSRKTGLVSRPGQPFGEEAFRALQSKLQFQRVRLDVMALDRKGKYIAIVWVDNRNINREMIDEGWAWAYLQDLDEDHESEYLRAEEQARSKRLGLWQQKDPQSPKKFRNLMRLKSWFTIPYL